MSDKTSSSLELTTEDAKQLADAVRRIDAGMKAIGKAGLTRHALVTLLKQSTGVSRENIEKVLKGLDELGRTYLLRG